LGSHRNDRTSHLFTSESVTMGHPDKVADQISDAVLDSLLAHDPEARVACETLVTTGLIVLAGEVTVHNTKALQALGGVEDTARETVKAIGYNDPEIGFDHRSCAVIRAIHSQSPDISQGVTATPKREQGAGDQGLMFGFACRETRTLMPLPIYLSHRLCERLAQLRQSGDIDWLRPDGKAQVTIEYKQGQPHRLHTVVVSTQYHEKPDLIDRRGDVNDRFREIIREQVIRPVVMDERPELWNRDVIFHINPTGRFVVGGPHGDTGLTGRKIIVDTYGGSGAHGGGAFSGKDPSKVDRSASYMARHIAKNLVAAGLADVCEVQLSYAIGVSEPISVLVDTQGSARVSEDVLSQMVREHFPLTPAEIIDDLKLRRPIYLETARHGHFGRNLPNFTWEKTHRAAALKKDAAKWMKE